MIKFIFRVLSVLALAASVFVYADTAPDFISVLEKTHTLSGKFRQTITDADGEEAADPTEGEFYLKRPGKFYWKTLPPFEQLVVGNDTSLTLYDPDLEQATIYGREEFLKSPAAVLSGDAELIKKKYTIEASSKRKINTYVLREKDLTNKSFETLTFVFDKSELLSLELKDQLGQMTSIRFNNIKKNEKVDEKLFVFVPPDDADVIINP